MSKGHPAGALALNDLSFEAGSGEITLLVRPSGCGKTPLLCMINRMVGPDSGRRRRTVGRPPPSPRTNCAKASAMSSSRQGRSPTRRSGTTSPRFRCRPASLAVPRCSHPATRTYSPGAVRRRSSQETMEAPEQKGTKNIPALQL
ncbi:ATP-binding cassette domain-containing protein [Streptomyces sp. LN785]|uniref:ATP-binding cassette domain-containing protein n=1 Tax=Streptomyces sp. LN785 TaxID=3112983 RepID=UPI00371B9279